LYKEISALTLDGAILDLGGSRKSGYHELMAGKHSITVVNIDDAAEPDLRFDLEKAFPLQASSYDSILAFNVLEHIFEYQNFLKESNRVLRSGGALVIGVPFLINVHPSPHDFWRYSGEALEKILASAGYSHVAVKALGEGPCLASVQLFSTVIRIAPIRAIFEWLAFFFDWLLSFVVPGKTLVARFPLGYYVIARK
jgi:SAM-dependent methyltransferase